MITTSIYGAILIGLVILQLAVGLVDANQKHSTTEPRYWSKTIASILIFCLMIFLYYKTGVIK